MAGPMSCCALRFQIRYLPPPSMATTPALMLSKTDSMSRRCSSSSAIVRLSLASVSLIPVTSRKTMMPPVTAPAASRSGVPLTLTYRLSLIRRLRMTYSTLPVDSPRMARTRGSSSTGNGVTPSSRYRP